MDRPAEGEPSPPPAPSPSSPQPPPPLQLPPTTTAGAATETLSSGQPSRYESQKRRDWNTFLQYQKGLKPSPLTPPPVCGGAHVLEFLKYLDQFGKTKVHAQSCAYFGQPDPPAPCSCPLRQAWGSLDALIGRLRAAYEEAGGQPESNPFAAMPVRIYLREVRDSQSKARGIPFEKKRKRRPALASPSSSSPSAAAASSTAANSVPIPEGGSGGVSPGDGDGV